MDNSLINSFNNISINKLKIKRNISINNFSNFKKNLFPHLFYDKKNSKIRISNKNLNTKNFIKKKLFKSTTHLKKHISISNINSTNNSKSNSKASSNNENKYKKRKLIDTSINLNKNLKKYNLINNDISFVVDQNITKPKEGLNINNKLSKILNKSKSIQAIKKNIKYFKTENNQKLIFNNLGMNYIGIEKNKKIDEKNELKLKQLNEKLKNKIKFLLEKNSNLENEKNERDNKIEILEEKINELINFIKNNKIYNLKNKINALEDTVEKLKIENNQLKKEINKKNRIIFNLSNDKLIKINKSIGKKKEKKNINNKVNKINNTKTNNFIDDKDIKMIKLISIDPDNF